MVDYTNPVETTFEMQRKSIQQGQQMLHQSLELQKRVNGAVVDAFDNSEAAQRRAVEIQQDALHNMLDAVEANVPGAEPTIADVREAVDEQYETLLDNHEEAFENLTTELEEGLDAYDEMTADYLDALGEQLDLLLEAHEELEAQSVDAAEQVGEGLEEVQAQVEEVQEQVREASEQAVEA